MLASVTFARSSIDVPAGAAAALEHALHARKIPTLGIWAQVPHYVSAMGYPAATLALLTGLHDVTGLVIDASAIRQESTIQRQRLDQLVASNDEHRTMVAQLEELYDQAQQQSDLLGMGGIPTGDELAAEFERFLRDQDS